MIDIHSESFTNIAVNNTSLFYQQLSSWHRKENKVNVRVDLLRLLS